MVTASLVLKETGAAFEMKQDPLGMQQLLTDEQLSQSTLANARRPIDEKIRVRLELVENTHCFFLDEQGVAGDPFTKENSAASNRYERGSGGVEDFFFSLSVDGKC